MAQHLLIEWFELMGVENSVALTFPTAVKDAGYVLEQTASDSSFQNGMAEQPNQTLGDNMRALLHGANLGPEYWSWAVLHAVYLQNRLPHKITNMTPLLAYLGK